MASMSTCFTFSYSRSFQTLKPPYYNPVQSLRLRPVFKARVLPLGVVRAAASAAPFRPGSVVESERLPLDVRRKAMDAVDACGGRVTIGDVASRAGMNVAEAQKALQAIAADTGGFLEVSDEGDVLYVFGEGYRSKLASKSFGLKIEPYVEKAKSAGKYLVMASLGMALIASIVIVIAGIILLLAAAYSSVSDSDCDCDSDSDKDKSRKGDGGSSFSSFSSYHRQSNLNVNLFASNDLEDNVDKLKSSSRRQPKQEESDGMNFFESVSSFVVGDGDPNQRLEEQRWKLYLRSVLPDWRIITANGGVVVAEELAPYLDVEATGNPGDDSYILPVLLRFDGQPELNEEGTILYTFPSLQRTASPGGCDQEKRVGGVEKIFREKKWEFSKASMSSRCMVVGLAGFNLLGVVILGLMLKEIPVSVTPTGFLKLVIRMFPILQIFAASVLAMPFARVFILYKVNKNIEKRNLAREMRARALEFPDPSLMRKILSARDMAQRISIGQDRIVYSTGKENYMFEKEYEEQELGR